MRVVVVGVLVGCLLAGGALLPRARAANTQAARVISFKASTGGFTLTFRSSAGSITITPKGKRAALAIRELPGGKSVDLLYGVRSVRMSGSTYVLKGVSSWASFTVRVEVGAKVPGLLHVQVSVTPRKDAPVIRQAIPDVQVVNAPAASLKLYAPATPIAGTSVFMSSVPLGSSILYLSNFTALGPFFNRTNSGANQGVFSYPNAGDRGSLVGAQNNGSFGYVPPPGSLSSLPRGKSTVVIDSYLYLLAGVPPDETAQSDMYLKMLGTVYDALPKPSLPAADWPALAAREAADLSDASNWVTVDGKRYLRAYVSDMRAAPELITQAGVLVGVKAYEARLHQTLPLDDALEQTLPSFYDQRFHAVVNGLASQTGADAIGESWYFVHNMISLLQLAQLGSQTARGLLLDSTDSLVALAHTNNYEFPQNFRYSDWSGSQSGVQPDVAGGYAWLMLGLYDLTHQQRYLDEAKAAMAHVAGKGFGLSYETHMSAYTAAAGERLFSMTKDSAYRSDALLALANLFHATRLWDCTYGNCIKEHGYHTYFGLNPLPWADYIATLEQYEAWLGLRDYMTYAEREPAYVKDLVGGFLVNTPLILQYALPPLLPDGVAAQTPSEYSFVPRNNLTWAIPLEDLRQGEVSSGVIGQEIYGAGGPFVLAASGSQM